MSRLCQCLFVVTLALASAAAVAARQIVVIEGLGGEPRYTEAFAEQVAAIERASRQIVPAENLHVFRVADAERDAILARFSELTATAQGDDELVVYLVGHGSYDDHHYKFNLPGPDLTGEDIAAVLDEQPAAMQLVINTSSASGVLAEALEADQRILVFATRSGRERHATRFGGYFAAALADDAADTDKSGSISAGEAFRFAERQVADYYERNNQLATEHATLSGARADRIVLARLGAATEDPAAASDAQLAALLAERQRMNGDIDALRLQRDDMAAADYQADLLEKMLALAELEEQIEAREQAVQDAN